MTAVKGFPSQIKNSIAGDSHQIFQTISKLDPKNKAAADVLPKLLADIGAGALPAETLDISLFPTIKNPELRIIQLTAHSYRVGDFVRFETGVNIGIELPVVKTEPNYLYLGGELLADPDTETFRQYRSVSPNATADGYQIVSTAPIYQNVIATTITDVTGTPIPASAAAPLEIIAATVADTKQLLPIDDIGEFIGLYSGAVAAEVLIMVLPPGYTGVIIDHEIPLGTRLSIRNMKNVAIATPTFLFINFLG